MASDLIFRRRGRGSVSGIAGDRRIKQKSGRAGGQAARPVFVFFARDAVPITPNAAPEAAEQTMLQLPFEKENGMEELAFAQQ